MLKLLSVKQLHANFIADLENRVVSTSSITQKPLDVIASPPMRSLRVYLYNLTKPPGGRSEDEYKIQIIIPGQVRGEKGNFDFSKEDHVVLLIGYEQNFGVWALWDAYLYKDISYSRNVQIKSHALIKAASSGFGEQQRETKNGLETVLTCSRKNLAEAVQKRISMWVNDLVSKI